MTRCRSLKVLEGLTPAEAAVHWLVRLDVGDLSATDQAAFDEWLADSPANEAAYAKACDAWDMVGIYADDPNVQALRASVLAGSHRPARAGLKRGLAAAAAIILTLGLGLSVSQGPDFTRWLPTSEARYETRVGERLNVVLSDGTAMTLNTDSRLSVRYRAERREVRMERGQAYFEVAHDPSRPFSVEGGGRRVTALGTRFEVHVDDRAFSTTLVEGSIAVDPLNTSLDTSLGARAQRVVLKPGETLTARAGRQAVVAPEPLAAALAWREGFVEFRDDSLASAVTEMNRYNPHPIRVRDERLNGLTVNGLFRAGRPEGFIEAMAQLHPIRPVRRSDGGVDLFWREADVQVPSDVSS